MSKEILKDKSVLITGATGGLGYAIAKELAPLVGCLFLSGRNQRKLNIVKQELSIFNDNIVLYEADFCKAGDVLGLATAALSQKIDILINSAGIFPLKNLADSYLEDYNNCFDINVKAPFLLSNALSKHMKGKGWGRIVNICSSSSYSGSKDSGLYCASKHALLGLGRSLYKELKGHGIRVFSVAPGSIQTDMGKTDTRQNFETFLNPEEVAEYISFIISYDRELVSEEIRINRFVIE